MMAVTAVNKENFEEKVMRAKKPVLLDLWAEWCGPCRMLSPIVEEISQEHPEIEVYKVNVDEEMELAMKFRATAIPMLVLVKDGQVAGTSVGYRSKEEIVAELL